MIVVFFMEVKAKVGMEDVEDAGSETAGRAHGIRSRFGDIVGGEGAVSVPNIFVVPSVLGSGGICVVIVLVGFIL